MRTACFLAAISNRLMLMGSYGYSISQIHWGILGKKSARGAENFPTPVDGAIFMPKNYLKMQFLVKIRCFFVNICPGVGNLGKIVVQGLEFGQKFWSRVSQSPSLRGKVGGTKN